MNVCTAGTNQLPRSSPGAHSWSYFVRAEEEALGVVALPFGCEALALRDAEEARKLATAGNVRAMTAIDL